MCTFFMKHPKIILASLLIALSTLDRITPFVVTGVIFYP